MELPFLPDRDFFTMREAARLAQVPPHTLRYWETRFGELRPARRAGGHRRYTRADLELVLEIKDLVHRRRMTVAGARRALLERRRGTPADARSASAADAGPALKLLREVKKEIKMLVDEFGR
ncbi:MAG: MerR family transcriptional regulator [Elusimicrobia bacterium]|nr:MerR family transcriptional regulator [Elusimicrobiota bacterium]